MDDREREEAHSYVKELGYEVMDEGIDTWCHDPRADDDSPGAGAA